MLNKYPVTAERRKKLTDMIKTAPLRFPYADGWDVLDQINLEDPSAKINIKYLAMQYILPEDMLVQYGLPADYLPPLMVSEYQAAKYVFGRIGSDPQIPKAVEIASFIGKSTTSFWKIGNSSGQATRPLSLSPYALERLSYRVFRESCHKIMFGETRPVVIPQPYGGLIQFISGLTPYSRGMILEAVKSIWFAHHGDVRTRYDIISDRLRMMHVHTAGQPSILTSWPSNGDTIKRFVQKYRITDSENIAEITPPANSDEEESGAIPFLALVSHELGQAIDFFVAQNFSSYTDLVCETPEGRSPLDDRDAAILADYLMSVNAAARSEMMTAIFATLNDLIGKTTFR